MAAGLIFFIAAGCSLNRLMASARAGDIEETTRLIEEKGVSVNSATYRGRTPLMEAARNGRTGVLLKISCK